MILTAEIYIHNKHILYPCIYNMYPVYILTANLENYAGLHCKKIKTTIETNTTIDPSE